MTPAEIKERRTALQLSQIKMAALLPVPRRTLEDWEAGRRNPPAYLWRALEHLSAELEAAHE